MKKTKKCSKCGEIKPLTEFCKQKENKDGFRGSCKVCCNKYKREYYKKNPGKIKKINEKWAKNNPEKVKEYEKYKRKYIKKYRKNNSEKVKKSKEKWIKNNPDKVKKYRKKRYKRLSKIPSYKINNAISKGIRKSLKGNKNGRHWETLVGYTLEDLKQHLEKQFEDWMNWNNHGVYSYGGERKWHIDHIKPMSSFNFETPEDKEIKECWALENLQPLEAVENIKKSNRLNYNKKRGRIIQAGQSS